MSKFLSDQTTRFVSTSVCESCGNDGYGTYGDVLRCHACGRIVESDDDDLAEARAALALVQADRDAALVTEAECREVLICSALHVEPDNCWCLEPIEVGSVHSPQCRMIREYLARPAPSRGAEIIAERDRYRAALEYIAGLDLSDPDYVGNRAFGAVREAEEALRRSEAAR